MIAENEPPNYSVSSYVGASILGVVLGVLLVILYFAISVFALLIGVYLVLILPISLLSGSYVSLVNFYSVNFSETSRLTRVQTPRP